jgi:uncharacterized protein YutE (UPF0331/DUF86 family)
MTRYQVIENKISFIKEQLGILESYKTHSREQIESDKYIKGSLERYLYLAIQGSIDLAEAFISYRNFRKPSTQGEAFEILRENNIIEEDLTKSLVLMVGMRNIISHAYQKINYDMIFKALHERLQDIEKYIERIEVA